MKNNTSRKLPFKKILALNLILEWIIYYTRRGISTQCSAI